VVLNRPWHASQGGVNQFPGGTRALTRSITRGVFEWKVFRSINSCGVRGGWNAERLLKGGVAEKRLRTTVWDRCLFWVSYLQQILIPVLEPVLCSIDCLRVGRRKTKLLCGGLKGKNWRIVIRATWWGGRRFAEQLFRRVIVFGRKHAAWGRPFVTWEHRTTGACRVNGQGQQEAQETAQAVQQEIEYWRRCVTVTS